MCGIHFILSKDVKHLSSIKSMMAQASHRGPDGENKITHTLGNFHFALGHNLLHVVGKDPVYQPLMNPHGILVFNGEIYNYKVLAKKYGISPILNDTAVLFQLLQLKGADIIPELNGMFALIWYNQKSNEILIVRDSYGQKPLYYALLDSGMVASSECQSLFKSNLVNKDINRKSVLEILSHKHVSVGNSIFNSILEVLPGEVIKINADLKVSKRFFKPNSSHNTKDLNTLFNDSISRHVTGDSAALLFSGGLDSSILLSHLKDQGLSPVCYTLDTSIDSVHSTSDTLFAKKLAQKLNVNHISVKADPKNFHHFIEHLDIPIGDGAFFLQNELSKEIAKDYKYALSGNGADELFAGYNRHLAFQKYKTYKNVFLFLKQLKFLMFLHPSPEKKRLLNRFLNSVSKNEWNTYQSFFSLRLTEIETKTEKAYFSLNEAIDYDFKNYLPQDLLKISDLAGMRHGLELRSPFLDFSITSYAESIAVNDLLKKGTKSILKDYSLSKKELFPIINRKKEGFGIPFISFFGSEVKKEMLTLIPLLNDFLDQKKLDTIKDIINLNDDSYSNEYWTLYILCSWLSKEL